MILCNGFNELFKTKLWLQKKFFEVSLTFKMLLTFLCFLYIHLQTLFLLNFYL